MITAFRILIGFTALVAGGCTTRISSSPVDLGGYDSPELAASAPPGTFYISPRNTRITFIGTALLNSHEGTFTRFSGRLDGADSDLAHARLSVDIDMNSISTEIPLLTKHLKEPDFFDVAKYPSATFVSTGITQSPAGDTLVGRLTLHGVARTLSAPAHFTVDPNHISLDATFTIRQSDFAMESARATTDAVPVTVSARLSRPGGTALSTHAH